MSFEQDRINAVEHKLTALSASIEQLNDSMGDVKVGLDAIRQDGQGRRVAGIIGDYSDLTSSRLTGMSGQHHKDILEDGDDVDGDSRGDANRLAPEMQVQRLTAQLTAAYSRIAALEEQLLSQRIH